jgi:hypothetical protein
MVRFSPLITTILLGWVTFACAREEQLIIASNQSAGYLPGGCEGSESLPFPRRDQPPLAAGTYGVVVVTSDSCCAITACQCVVVNLPGTLAAPTDPWSGAATDCPVQPRCESTCTEGEGEPIGAEGEGELLSAEGEGELAGAEGEGEMPGVEGEGEMPGAEGEGEMPGAEGEGEGEIPGEGEGEVDLCLKCTLSMWRCVQRWLLSARPVPGAAVLQRQPVRRMYVTEPVRWMQRSMCVWSLRSVVSNQPVLQQ